jgi:lipopolysaccharide transport system ATP-binding protein
MQAFRDVGTTVAIVTHDMAAVAALCARAAWLEHGKICSMGPAAKVIEDYRAA